MSKQLEKVVYRGILTQFYFCEFLGRSFSTDTRVESRTGAVTVVSRWIVDSAFASSPQSGLAWCCFLFPLIEPDRQISRIRLSEKTHDVPCDAVCNCLEWTPNLRQPVKP